MNVLALVHEDGHVAALSLTEVSDQLIRDRATALERAGVTGFSVQDLGLHDASRRYIGGAGCTACQIGEVR